MSAPTAAHIAEARHHAPKTEYERVLLAALDHVAERLRENIERQTLTGIPNLIAYIAGGPS